MSSDDKADKTGRRVATTIVGGRVVPDVLADAVAKPKISWEGCNSKEQDLSECFEKNKGLIEDLMDEPTPRGMETTPLSPLTEEAANDFGLVLLEGSYGTAGEGMDSLFEELTTPWGKETQPLGPIIEQALAADADDDE
jgi:hypothetical protein